MAIDRELLIFLCAGFLTPQIFYGIRWKKFGGGKEKLLRSMAYAFFVGLLNFLTLFAISKLYGLHFFAQILISLLGSLYMLKLDYYFHFIKGVPPPKSDQFFIGGLWTDPESIEIKDGEIVSIEKRQ